MKELQTTGKVMAITIGIPASGKTSWALQKDFDMAVSLDDCRRELWGDAAIQDHDGGIEAVLKLQSQKIRQAIDKGQSIVVHNTHTLRKYRKPLIEMAKNAGYLVWLIFFDVDSEECKKRNSARSRKVADEIMEKFIAEIEVPRKDEADVVLRLSEMIG